MMGSTAVRVTEGCKEKYAGRYAELIHELLLSTQWTTRALPPGRVALALVLWK